MKLDHYAHSASQPLLDACKIILASWQARDGWVREAVPGKDRAAMQRRSISICLDGGLRGYGARPHALLPPGQFEVFSTKHSVCLDPLAELLSDRNIARPGHALIDFVYQQQVRESQHRVFV